MSASTAQRSARLWFIDGLAHVHVSGEDTDGRYAVLEILVPEGDMPPLHVHHEEDEVFHILDGEVTHPVPARDGGVARNRRDIPCTPGRPAHVSRRLADGAVARLLRPGTVRRVRARDLRAGARRGVAAPRPPT